MHRVH